MALFKVRKQRILQLASNLLIVGKSLNECCTEKTVGGIRYTLVESGVETSSYGCEKACVYEQVEKEGSRFCFKAGHLPVECNRHTIGNLAYGSDSQ